MAKLPPIYELTPLPDDHELGPEYQAIQDAAQSDTVTRIASIVSNFDGTNATALAHSICNMIFEGEPIEDE
jgi:hypothetical protein